MSEDSIKRSNAIKTIEKRKAKIVCNYESDKWFRKMVSEVKAIPSADRPQGEWIDKGKNLWECSNCEMTIYSESKQDRNEFHKWCSRCGARMKGADDE